jgi:two-component system nitrogen regulation response regulator NtrX
VIPIHVPPLRERTEDISMLLCHFLKSLKTEISLEDGAVEVLTSHDWPGNVRELKNLAERIAVMHQGPVITGDDLVKLLNKKSKKPQNTGNQLPEGILERNYNEAKDSFEKGYLEFQLLKNNGIITRTAEAIGIYPSNLHAKLRKYNITAANVKEEL